MRFWYLFIAIICVPVWATTFRPQSVDQQLVEADGVIVGNFLRQESVKLGSGMIATQMIFKVNKEWGLQSDTFGMDEVIVHFPGGSWEGLRVEVAGVPSFVSGEKVVLLTKSKDGRFWGLNLGMGTYKVINYGKDTMLINTIFPQDPIIGQVGYSDFEMKVKKVKGSRLKTVQVLPDEPNMPADVIRAPASQENGQKRAIASISEEEDNDGNQSGLSAFWLVTLLAVAGGVFRFMRRDA